MSEASGDTTCDLCGGSGADFCLGGPYDCAGCDGSGVDATAPRYTRPNTGDHPDHPPVEGGYRGGCAYCGGDWFECRSAECRGER